MPRPSKKAEAPAAVEAPATDDEEYEVERVLSDRKNNRSKTTEFLVSWVGYGPSENTWLPEVELAGCQDLLNEYWSRKRSTADSRKSAASGAPRGRKRKSATTANTSTSTSAAAKRTRTSASSVAFGDTSMDGAGGGDNNKAESSEEDADPDSGVQDEDDLNPDRVQQLMSHYLQAGLDWEEEIQNIVTVERNEQGQLKFFVEWKDNNRWWIGSDLMYERCPQKVIRFFEAHLKFKRPAGH